MQLYCSSYFRRFVRVFKFCSNFRDTKTHYDSLENSSLINDINEIFSIYYARISRELRNMLHNYLSFQVMSEARYKAMQSIVPC